MNETEARLKIMELIAGVLVDFAIEDDPDADRAELTDIFLDVAADICDDLALEVTGVNETGATVTVQFGG